MKNVIIVLFLSLIVGCAKCPDNPPRFKKGDLVSFKASPDIKGVLLEDSFTFDKYQCKVRVCYNHCFQEILCEECEIVQAD